MDLPPFLIRLEKEFYAVISHETTWVMSVLSGKDKRERQGRRSP